MKERKIDEEFNQDEFTLKTILSENCKGCYFDIKKNGHCYDTMCARDERSDKLDVKFVIIKKD